MPAKETVSPPSPDFLAEAGELFDYTQAIRRDLHAHPELGFQEYRTAGVVARELNQLGLETHTGIAETGVVAMLEGAQPGPVIMLRFDMDALPITEETGVPYASQNPGVMHACGHDGHVAVGLTVARLLNRHRQRLAGSVKFVFQPAEEGLGGASRMIAAGVLENPRPDIVMGLHIWNELPLGWLGINKGATMSAAEIFTVSLIGRGGHGAIPDATVDPVIAAAQIVTALQTVVSRNVSPLQSAVVSVTTLRAGDAFNVIPSEARLQGTIRTFDPAVRSKVLDRFHQIVSGVSQAMGCQAEIELESLTPAMINHPEIAQRVQQVAARILPESIQDNSYATLGSEDMAYFMQEIPSCYFFVGSANPEEGLDAGHHHPRFNFDERVLPRAAALLAASVGSYLLEGQAL